MGCDIHGWVERKVENKWVAVIELVDNSRAYSRFSRLANVRTYGFCNWVVRAPKGMPEDVSDTAKYHIDSWDVDGHSHSHLPLQEAFDVFKAGCSAESNYDLYSAFGLDDYELDMEEYRLVFWFDN